MARTLTVLALAIPALLLTGCVSEDEKKEIDKKTKDIVANEIANAKADINYQIQQEVKIQLQAAIEDHARKVAAAKAALEAEKAKKAAPGPVKPGTTVKKKTN
jgi:hypothetical protein